MNSDQHFIRLASLIVLVASSLAGCSEEGEPTPSDEACEHAQGGPSSAVTAGSAPDSSAGDVTEEHTRHDVTLVAVDGGNGGFVQFNSEGGEHIFFLTRDIPIAFQDAAAALVPIEQSSAEETCDEVVVAHRIDLPVGRIILEFGPTAETSVSVLIEPVAHDEAHGDGA